jgi:2,3-bisphosphoglycerate-independent phosphoglycerate mutase
MIQTGDHISTTAALAQLGVSPFAYYGERAFLLAIVGVTSALAAKVVIFRLAEWAVTRVNQSAVMAPRKTRQTRNRTATNSTPKRRTRKTRTGTRIGIAS